MLYLSITRVRAASAGEYFFLQCHHMFVMNFRGFPPGCGDSVADFWGWDAHEARLRCPDDVSGDMQQDDNTRRGLKPKSTNYPDRGHHGNLSLHGKIPMVEPGIEPGTSWLVVRDPDH